ncbi:MAG: hypothetical protein WCD07_02415 [Burkholderiales bacterium]
MINRFTFPAYIALLFSLSANIALAQNAPLAISAGLYRNENIAGSLKSVEKIFKKAKLVKEGKNGLTRKLGRDVTMELIDALVISVKASTASFWIRP